MYQNNNSSFYQQHKAPGGDNRSLADVETQKVSTPMPASSQHKESARKTRTQVPLSKRRKTVRVVMAILLLLPSIMLIFELINGFLLYRQMQDGIDHLQAAQNVFRGSSTNGVSAYFDMGKLQQAQEDIDVAHADFSSLSAKLGSDGALALVAHLWPSQINAISTLGHLADDGTAVLQQLLKTMRMLAPSVAPAFQSNPANTSSVPLKPYLTPAAYQTINTTLDTIAPLVHRMAVSTHGVSLAALPISDKQRGMLTTLLPLLPLLDGVLAQRSTFRNSLGWFLGIDSQRAFLLEPMDSAELRATGGFTGQFGELVLNGAHVGPLKLSNIGKYEEDHTLEGSPPDMTVYPKVIGQQAPAPYATWWPIGNFGLRDANLSADFPTSARIAMERYRYEFGTNLDGVIMFTPTLISHVLHVTGPISIPAYHQTITEHNLEDLLHYYQLNNTGIRQEEIVEHIDDNQVARKLFTQRVTTALLNTVTHLPLTTMFSLANELLHSMKSKDLQVYVTDAQLEALIGKYGSTASLDRATSHDGLFIVQSNVSASKASQYVTTTLQDSVVLDQQGGSTHHLQIMLQYQQKGDVYGFDTYRDYLRVYVPTGSQLLSGNGFDQAGRPYCGDAQSGYRLCQPDVYGDGSLLCASPLEIGYATTYLSDPYMGKDHPLDVTGAPQNQQSDEAGRALFGGWVVIPKNCTAKVALSWHVPPMGPYSLHLQAQASVYAPLDLTLQPAAGSCNSAQDHALRFSHLMDGEDIMFTLKRQGAQCSLLAAYQ